MSGVGFLATMKTFAPSIRRRRRVDKQNLELHNNGNGKTPGAGDGSGHRSSSAATTPTTGPAEGSGRGGVAGIAAGIVGVGEVISPSSWDIVPPITPPAAFLPPGYKRLSMKGKIFGRRTALNSLLCCVVVYLWRRTRQTGFGLGWAPCLALGFTSPISPRC